MFPTTGVGSPGRSIFGKSVCLACLFGGLEGSLSGMLAALIPVLLKKRGRYMKTMKSHSICKSCFLHKRRLCDCNVELSKLPKPYCFVSAEIGQVHKE